VSSEIAKDAWEDWPDALYVQGVGCELEAQLRIAYVDANGQKTFRTVTTERFARTPEGGILVAHCHLRAARRPFRIGRVEFAAELSTGTRIDNLLGWLEQRYTTTPKGLLDAFWVAHEAALVALHHVAKADGAMRAPERAILKSFCQDVGALSEETAEAVVGLAATLPTSSAIMYGRALRELAERDENYRRKLADAADAMLGSDKTVKDSERHAVKRLRETLGI
jgi:uncharacterized tellurite resistance protein B-like protein